MRRYVVAVAVLGLLVWSSVGLHGPALTVHGESPAVGFGVGAVIPTTEETRTVGVAGICMTGGRVATVTGVTLEDAHGLAVEDFGTARIGPGRPEVPGVMAQTPSRLGYTHESVTQRCDEDGVVALALSLRVVDPADAARAWAGGATVRYVLDGTPGALTVRGHLTLCVLPMARLDECRHPDEVDSDG